MESCSIISDDVSFRDMINNATNSTARSLALNEEAETLLARELQKARQMFNEKLNREKGLTLAESPINEVYSETMSIRNETSSNRSVHSHSEAGALLAHELLARELQAREMLNHREPKKTYQKAYQKTPRHANHQSEPTVSQTCGLTMSMSLQTDTTSKTRWANDSSLSHDSTGLPATFLLFKFEQLEVKWSYLMRSGDRRRMRRQRQEWDRWLERSYKSTPPSSSAVGSSSGRVTRNDKRHDHKVDSKHDVRYDKKFDNKRDVRSNDRREKTVVTRYGNEDEIKYGHHAGDRKHEVRYDRKADRHFKQNKFDSNNDLKAKKKIGNRAELEHVVQGDLHRKSQRDVSRGDNYFDVRLDIKHGSKSQRKRRLARPEAICATEVDSKPKTVARGHRDGLMGKPEGFIQGKGSRLQTFSAVVLQAMFRKVLCEQAFQRLRNSCVVIQSWARMLLLRRKYKRLCPSLMLLPICVGEYFERVHKKKKKKAVISGTRMQVFSIIIIQTWWRERSCHVSFLELRNSAISIQAWWRQRVHKSAFSKLRRSAIAIQAWSRKRSCEIAFSTVRRSVVTLQTWCRTWSCQLAYEEVTCCIIIVQSWVRMIDCRYHFRKKLKEARRLRAIEEREARSALAVSRIRPTRLHVFSVILLQAWFRKISCISEYLATRNVVVRIQSWYRSRVDRNSYAKTYQSVLVVQQWFKTISFQRSAQEKLRKRRDSALMRCQRASIFIIHDWFLMVSYRLRFLKLRRSSVVLQRWIRHQLEKSRKTIQSLPFKGTRIQILCARSIQQWYRKYRMRVQFLEQKWCAMFIQAIWRGALDKRRFKLQKRSVLILQSALRMSSWRRLFVDQRQAASKIQRWNRSLREKRAAKLKAEIESMREFTYFYQSVPSTISVEEEITPESHDFPSVTKYTLPPPPRLSSVHLENLSPRKNNISDRPSPRSYLVSRQRPNRRRKKGPSRFLLNSLASADPNMRNQNVFHVNEAFHPLKDRIIAERLEHLKRQYLARLLQSWFRRQLRIRRAKPFLQRKSLIEQEIRRSELPEDLHLGSIETQDPRSIVKRDPQQSLTLLKSKIKTRQRRKGDFEGTQAEGNATTAIQCLWRSHRARQILATALLQEWSVTCFFSPEQVKDDRCSKQKAILSALKQANNIIDFDGISWKPGKTGKMVAVFWEGLVPLNSSEFGTARCSVRVKCSARCIETVKFWSRRKLKILVGKAAIEKYAEEQRQKIRRASLLERSLTRRRVPSTAPRSKMKPLQGTGTARSRASQRVGQKVARRPQERVAATFTEPNKVSSRTRPFRVAKGDKSRFAVKGVTASRKFQECVIRIQSWMRMQMCRSRYIGLRHEMRQRELRVMRRRRRNGF